MSQKEWRFCAKSSVCTVCTKAGQLKCTPVHSAAVLYRVENRVNENRSDSLIEVSRHGNWHVHHAMN